LVDSSRECVQVHEQIYPCIGEDRHAPTVIPSRIHMVYTNGIGTQRLHEGSIERALGCVDERIRWQKLVCNACLSY
jgi:hypothetical protein